MEALKRVLGPAAVLIGGLVGVWTVVLLARDTEEWFGIGPLWWGGVAIGIATVAIVATLWRFQRRLDMAASRLDALIRREIAVAGKNTSVDWQRDEYLRRSLGVSDGRNALHLAAYDGRTAVVDALIAAGQDYEQGDKDGYTPLIVAAERGHIGIVERFLSHHVNLNAANNCGSTALYLACDAGHDRIVDLLLQAGANVNRPNTEGTTPLMVAAHQGHLRILERLLEEEARVDRKDADGATVLDYLLAGSQEEDVLPVMRRTLEARGAMRAVPTLMRSSASRGRGCVRFQWRETPTQSEPNDEPPSRREAE